MNWWPEMPAPVLLGFREFYGTLLLLTLVQLLSQWRRFFISDRWQGYAKSSWAVDAVHHPLVSPLVGLVWLGCGVGLLAGWHVIWAAALNTLICRYFFIFMRWHGVLRGYGAPGYMTYWFGFALLLLEATSRYAPSVQPLALLVIQVDFALIIFSAAYYKFRSGYPRGEGMDYGLVNPMWSYWPRFFRRLAPGHWVFRMLNQLAWSSQMVSAILMMVPATRFWGGLVIFLTYVFLVPQIRLGFLAEMMWLGGLLFCVAGTPGVNVVSHLISFTASQLAAPPSLWSPTVQATLSIGLWVYLVALPLCHAGLFINFYGRRRLPKPFQSVLEHWTNFFGIILWRVFSVDHLNFHVAIFRLNENDGSRHLLSEWQNPFNLRFWNVGEAIAVTSLFTTLKYYPSNDAIFSDRLVRYARTFSCEENEAIVFDYICIRKMTGGYKDLVACTYHVKPSTGTVEIVQLDPSLFPGAAHAGSPIHEGARPGTYAPAK